MKNEEKDNKAQITPEGWRRPTDQTRHHRENNWNYRGEGIYHITLVVAERYPLFGRLEGETPETAYVQLNEYGRRVLDVLRDEPRFYGEKGYALKLIATQVMPDHIHMVVQVLAPLPKPIGVMIRGFKSACTSLYKREMECCRKYATKMKDEGESVFHFSRIFSIRMTSCNP